MYHEKHYEFNYGFEWCNDGMEIMSFDLAFEYIDEYHSNRVKNSERNFDRGTLQVPKDIIQEMLTDIPVRKNYLIYVIEEWFEDTLLDEVSTMIGRDDISIEKKVQLEQEYMLRRSTLFDIEIIIKLTMSKNKELKGCKVVLSENMPINVALRKFKQVVNEAGVLETLKEKMYEYSGDPLVCSPCDQTEAQKLVEIAENFAIGFSEWLRTKVYYEHLTKEFMYRGDTYKSEKDLIRVYKKENNL